MEAVYRGRVHRMRSISDIKEGELVTLIKIQGGNRVTKRLTELGLTPGVKIKVITNHNRGPVIIEVRGTHLCIGRGESLKVVVE